MSAAMLWPYGKCVECANKSDCVDSQAQIIACMSNGYPDFKPRTNADRIRAMTDEELDDFLNTVQGDAYLVGFQQRAESRFTPYGKKWLDWLREEGE